MLVIGVGGAHADDGGQAAFDLLVGVEPGRRAVAWSADVEGNRVGVLRLAFVATSYGGSHTGIEAGSKNIAVVVAGTSPDIAKREAEEVGAMFQGKLNTLDEMCRLAFTFCT